MDQLEVSEEPPTGNTLKERQTTETSVDPPPKKPGSKAQGRKRTKTGCLSSASSIPNARRGESFSSTGAGHKTTPIAPKPPSTFVPHSNTFDSSSISPLPVVTSPDNERRVYNFPDSVPSQSSNQNAPPPLPHSAQGRAPRPYVDTKNQSQKQGSRTNPPHAGQISHYDFNSLTQAEGKKPLINPPGRFDESRRGSKSSTQDLPRKFSAPAGSYQSSASSAWNPSSASTVSSNPFTPSVSSATTLQSALDSAESFGRFEQGTTSDGNGPIYQPPLPIGTYAPQVEWNISQPGPLDRYDTMEEDDDPFDISDDNVEMGENSESGVWEEVAQDDHLKNNDLGIVVALQANQDNHGLSIRSFTSFIDRPNMLATYVPSSQSTPLRDPMTARIFCHFVNVTAPSISMFERHPANPSLIFQGEPVPKAQQHIWTYTFPTLALQNPGLLHAMLAIASLHIAKLQNGPITASFKHYALSLRRVAKSVSLPTRRGHPATLAAALLLAFYECWSADHQKWTNHLLGARQLVREIGFAEMTRYIKRRTAEDRRQKNQLGRHGEEIRFPPHVDEVDETLISILMGNKVRYDQFGHIMDDDVLEHDQYKEYTKRDLEIYETQRDLFWWYCKQDTYQSILGGGRLFMDYSLWSHCPPRAPIGRLNSIYGTFDHLILLMGRMANFAAKDVKRKQFAMKMNGGRWQPPDSIRIPPQASQSLPNHGLPQTPKQPAVPGFSGMVPDVKDATLPMGFDTSRDTSPQSSTQSDDIDFQAQTEEAEEEWQDIRNAFTVLENHLGEDFQALGPEFSAPIQTPFGPALQYRTFGIAGIWMNYYMALIACHRAHPSMPPAAMMAAGIAARQTAFFANQIGRITAGIAPDCSMTAQVNPSLGAALMESCTCLFVAGVQYQDAEQRSWTVCRLRDIARLTGFQSALAVASGCETSWVKAYELGKGPPYTRTKEERVVPSIWSNSRRIDRAFDGKSSAERRLVIERTDRVHYAMGILSLEEDFEELDMDTNPRT
ncbi:hypothetical protein EG329_010206 [Mollisiaceae sp. DMI_Dod_QoI]|nr:hypothetical protein EG329_010206 [Helotiales sp. DMI_Dod_QoI]